MGDLCSKLAEWVTSIDFDTPALLTKARILLVDAVALAAAARNSSAVRAFGAMMPQSTGAVTGWADGVQRAPLDAVLINALLVHDRFQDDCEMTSWTHPASFVIPAAMAAAEVSKAPFGSALKAIVVGYAVTAWLGANEVVALNLMKRGFRCSPVLAPFASATAYARGSGYTAESTRAALSSAALLGRGTLQAVAGGGEDWRWQNATAARDGVTVAIAACAGMRAAREALEGPHGFLATYCGLSEIPDRWRELPNLNDVLSVWHKAYPTLGDNMAAALAASLASKRLPKGVGIRAVHLTMPTRFAEFPGTQGRPPFVSATEALASVRFTVALGLRHGCIEREHYETFTDESTVALTRLVEVDGDETLQYTEARLGVEMADGSKIEVLPADLPRSAFFRDEASAVFAAQKLLGDAGRRMAEDLLGAKSHVSTNEVLRDAIQSLRKSPRSNDDMTRKV